MNNNFQYLEAAEEKLYKLAQTSSCDGVEANDRLISPLDGNHKKSGNLKRREIKSL